MNDSLPIAALADPGPLAQLVGIAVTCVGTILSLWAALSARSAATAARRARAAAERNAALSELDVLREDLSELNASCEMAEVVWIRRQMVKLGSRLGVSAGPVAADDVERLTVASKRLFATGESLLNPRPADSTKRREAAAALSEAQVTVASVQRNLRDSPPRNVE